MEISLTNIIVIKRPTKELLNWCKDSLIFKNPEYIKKVHMGLYVGKTPKTIKLFDYDKYDNELYIPSGCFDDIKRFITIDDDIYDYRSTPIANITSKIVLRDYQAPSQQVFDKHSNAIISFFCGGGKTEVALALAAQLGVKTLFLTHTQDLVNQAYDRCGDRLICKRSFIKEGKVDLSGDIVFGLVQTLANRLDAIPQNEFGLVIVDECHRTAVNAKSIGMFRQCIEYFSAKYKLGLSATLHRSDKLEQCIPYIIGHVVYNIDEDRDEYVGFLDNKEIIRFPKDKFQVPVKINTIISNYATKTDGCYHDVFDKNDVLVFSKLLTDISLDSNRNDIIIDIATTKGSSVLILSDRVDQLHYLASKIPNSIVITGKTPKKQREQGFKDIDCGKKRVLLSSFKLAKEGLNILRLDTLIFATPIKDLSTIVQSIGRIQRPNDKKEIANVFDIDDKNVFILHKFWLERKKVYKEKGWY